MTEVEYNNMRPGDVIFNLKNKDAHIVKEVCDGFVRWEDGGSTPSRYLKGWDYVSLMREREEAPNTKVVSNLPKIKFPFKKTSGLKVGDIVGPIEFKRKNAPFTSLAKVVDTQLLINSTTFKDEYVVTVIVCDENNGIRLKLDNDKEYPLMWREPKYGAVK
jgi:hypothetical protein